MTALRRQRNADYHGLCAMYYETVDDIYDWRCGTCSMYLWITCIAGMKMSLFEDEYLLSALDRVHLVQSGQPRESRPQNKGAHAKRSVFLCLPQQRQSHSPPIPRFRLRHLLRSCQAASITHHQPSARLRIRLADGLKVRTTPPFRNPRPSFFVLSNGNPPEVRAKVPRHDCGCD